MIARCRRRRRDRGRGGGRRLPLATLGTIALGAFHLSKFATDQVIANRDMLKDVSDNSMLGAISPDYALGIAAANAGAIQEAAKKAAAQPDFTLGSRGGFQSGPRTEVGSGQIGPVSNRTITQALGSMNVAAKLSGSAEVTGRTTVDVQVTVNASPELRAELAGAKSAAAELRGRLTAGSGPGGTGDSTASTRGGNPGMGAAP